MIMQNFIRFAGVSALALVAGAPVYSQGALVGVEALDERIEDIEENIAEEMREGDDPDRFRTNQYAQGWTGSVSLGFAATSGNTDTADLSVAGRVRYGVGPWNHTVGFAGEFAEDNDTRNKEEVYATYDVNRYFNEDFYVFGLGSARYDNFSTNEWDVFIGAGPGYRIINQPNLSWRVQAGPGVRYQLDQAGDEEQEVAGIASSRYYYQLSEAIFLTNDTDFLFSDSSNLVTNDAGVNFRVSDNLSTRFSYRTEYTSDPLPGFDDVDNTIGASLVYGF
jgi:putative salt-induced outer membrane protein